MLELIICNAINNIWGCGGRSLSSEVSHASEDAPVAYLGCICRLMERKCPNSVTSDAPLAES